MPHVPVRIGLELQRLATLGTTGWNGELHATWRGFEPSLDLVLEISGSSSSPLRKVHLAAGQAETIFVAVDVRSGNFLRAMSGTKGELRLSAERAKSAQGLSALGYGGTSWNFPGVPTFAKDEAGNGMFQDPWIVNAKEERSKTAVTLGGGRIDEIRMKESRAVVGRFSATKQQTTAPVIPDAAQLDGIVRDEHGDPLPGVLVTTLTESDGGSWETTTDVFGRFSYAVPHGRAIVLAGGGDRAIPRQDIELAANETRALDIQCVKLEMTHVRLLDEEKHPLVGWRVEGRQTNADQYLTGRGDTDESGIATLFLPERPHGRVFLRPGSESVSPKMKIDAPIVGRASDGDIVLRASVSPGQIDLSLQTEQYAPVEARLWRADSKEGMRMPLIVMAAQEQDRDHKNLLRATNLLPGEYEIEFGARGVPWRKIGPFYLQPGQALDAGTYTLESPAQVKISGASDQGLPIVTVRALVNGLWLEGQTASKQGLADVSLMTGEWTLSVGTMDKSGTKSLLGPRKLKAESGRTVELELEETVRSH